MTELGWEMISLIGCFSRYPAGTPKGEEAGSVPTGRFSSDHQDCWGVSAQPGSSSSGWMWMSLDLVRNMSLGPNPRTWRKFSTWASEFCCTWWKRVWITGTRRWSESLSRWLYLKQWFKSKLCGVMTFIMCLILYLIHVKIWGNQRAHSGELLGAKPFIY